MNPNETQLQGAASDSFSMDGTFSDPDGDAVTLTASIGTITDNGDGTWSWSGSAAASQLVYVTADDGDQKDQAVFKLKDQSAARRDRRQRGGERGSHDCRPRHCDGSGGYPRTQAWSYAPVSGVDPGATCSFASFSSLDTTVTCTDDGIYTITSTVSDGSTCWSSRTAR